MSSLAPQHPVMLLLSHQLLTRIVWVSISPPCQPYSVLHCPHLKCWEYIETDSHQPSQSANPQPKHSSSASTTLHQPLASARPELRGLPTSASAPSASRTSFPRPQHQAPSQPPPHSMRLSTAVVRIAQRLLLTWATLSPEIINLRFRCTTSLLLHPWPFDCAYTLV